MDIDDPKLKAKIEAERRALGLRPWEFAPSEIDDGPNPYPPGAGGHDSWNRAKALRDQVARARRVACAGTKRRKS